MQRSKIFTIDTVVVAGALSKIQELQKEVDTKEQTIEDFQRVLHEQQRSLQFCSNQITIIRDRIIRWGQRNARNIAEPESFATNHCSGKRVMMKSTKVQRFRHKQKKRPRHKIATSGLKYRTRQQTGGSLVFPRATAALSQTHLQQLKEMILKKCS